MEFTRETVDAAVREVNSWFSPRSHLKIISVQKTETPARVHELRVHPGSVEVTVWYEEP